MNLVVEREYVILFCHIQVDGVHMIFYLQALLYKLDFPVQTDEALV